MVVAGDGRVETMSDGGEPDAAAAAADSEASAEAEAGASAGAGPGRETDTGSRSVAAMAAHPADVMGDRLWWGCALTLAPAPAQPAGGNH